MMKMVMPGQRVPRSSSAWAGMFPNSGTYVHLILELLNYTLYPFLMPWGLKRFHQSRDLHFLTFSCYGRKPKLGTPFRRYEFERALEQTRLQYGLLVTGYVVMPEHVHLLVSEPPGALLSRAIQSLKQSVSRRLALRASEPFWHERYYDFNVWSDRKRIEKLRYMHRNPVKRGMVERPEDWAWSSFNHYATGVEGLVEIESFWTTTRRERMGILPKVGMIPPVENPRPSEARTGHPQGGDDENSWRPTSLLNP